MKTPTYIALSRQTALTRELNTVANNIANVSTDGYRAKHTLFQEYLARTGEPGRRDRLSFTQDVGEYRDATEGKIQTTGNPFNVAIHGDGYFTIGNPAQQFYTRNGAFHLDGNRQLVTADGYPVLQADGSPIVVPQPSISEPGKSEITIEGDGSVYVATSSNGIVTSGKDTPLGKIALVRFNNDQVLRQAGSGFYATDATPIPVDTAQSLDTRMVQGAIESSNVEPVLEMTKMMSILRDYQSLQNLADAENERQRNANAKIIQQV
jgi:flagellar basal-body rod protein FlgF